MQVLCLPQVECTACMFKPQLMCLLMGDMEIHALDMDATTPVVLQRIICYGSQVHMAAAAAPS